MVCVANRLPHRRLPHGNRSPARLAGGVAVILLSSVDRAGWPQTPVSMAGLAVAAGILAMFWRSRPYAHHHLAFAAVLAGISLLPLGAVAPVDGLHPLSSSSGVSASLAAFFLVGGLGDHLLLARTLRREPAPR